MRTLTLGVPAALIPVGASVSHPKERLDGHALATYPFTAIAPASRSTDSRHERAVSGA
jgi:hypothetical protein